MPDTSSSERQYSEEDLRVLSLQFTNEACSITNDSDTATKRAKMSCGHAVDPGSLTAWCRSLLDQRKYKFHCPAITDKTNPAKPKSCEKVWPYDEVRRVALLNDAECMFFEAKMSEYAADKYCDMKECPGCRSFVERGDLTNLRVQCLVCTKKNQKFYEFCWNCLEEWSGPVKSSVQCGNADCEHPSMQDIRNAPKISLMSGTIRNVPSRRACPNCGWISEHTGEACKMRQCRRCKREFCFACLQSKFVCLRTGSSYFGACSKPVAPEQTSIPVWNREEAAHHRILVAEAEGDGDERNRSCSIL